MTDSNKLNGYGGLFWGAVYDSDELRILSASDYFVDLAESNDLDMFTYCDAINELINHCCHKQFDSLLDKTTTHCYQSGFGGSNCDGLIDFWLPKPIPEMPDIQFIIDDKRYTLRWTFSSSD